MSRDYTVYDRNKAQRILEKYELDPDQISVWAKKFSGLKANAPFRDAQCFLILSQYVRLAIKAGIKDPAQIGTASDQFQVARHGDTGDYEWGNCRFVTAAQNQAERTENGGALSQGNTRRGWTKHNHAGMKSTSVKNSKSFVLKSPSGRVHTGLNLSEFARKYDLNQGAISAVCRGAIDHYKGWTGTYKETHE